MPSPTDGPLDPFGPGGPLTFTGPAAGVLELWARPLRPLLPEVRGAIGKPLAEVTVHEVLACLVTFGYVLASVMLAEAMLLNLGRVAIRGR
jgi:hypothetical protein